MNISGRKDSPSNTQKILSAKTKKPIPTPSPFVKKEVTPKPRLSKNFYVIAAFGDSMIDTMGENLDYVEIYLKTEYPNTNFKLYNYGIGGENVEMGLARWNNPLIYKDRNYPPITQINADVIILGSFSYNPFDPHSKDRHYIGLTNLINEAKKTNADIYLLAEIAPLSNGFGQGKNGPNMLPEKAINQANNIIEQLNGTVSLAAELNIPLINAFSESQLNGKYGRRDLVNADDGIHPSEQGEHFVAQKIVSVVKLK